MKAKDLQPGQEFKREGQRKWRTVSNVIANSQLPTLKGKVLIILDNCGQLVLSEECEIILKTTTYHR